MRDGGEAGCVHESSSRACCCSLRAPPERVERARPPEPRPRAYAIRVVVPGQAGASLGTVSAPPTTSPRAPASPIRLTARSSTTGSVTASASTDTGSSAVASASSEVQSLILFGWRDHRLHGQRRRERLDQGALGERRLLRRRSRRADRSGPGRPAGPNGRVALADWGYLITLEQGTDRSSGAGGAQGFHGFVTALDIHLTAPHGGLPAGAEIQSRLRGGERAGERGAAAQAGRARAGDEAQGREDAEGAGAHDPRPLAGAAVAGAPGLQPELTAGGYVFPVYGPLVSFGDSYGAFRGDVAGNWHHGDDIFAPLGAPSPACADGTVFSVGWNDVGGNRLWLRDSQGNEFYYAHLSAFSPLARTGAT